MRMRKEMEQQCMREELAQLERENKGYIRDQMNPALNERLPNHKVDGSQYYYLDQQRQNQPRNHQAYPQQYHPQSQQLQKVQHPGAYDLYDYYQQQNESQQYYQPENDGHYYQNQYPEQMRYYNTRTHPEQSQERLEDQQYLSSSDHQNRFSEQPWQHHWQQCPCQECQARKHFELEKAKHQK